ncbi:hypothetical protein ACH4XT_36995 [Streptomyces avidinii]|uniref:hypothetical protein n=1 Tax=Streptomyces avidinii TaxID=1895 RepID=UPI0037AEB494
MVSTFQERKLRGMFAAFDADGDGHLSRERFALLWRQFWISDDPADPGNVLCGRIPGPR